MYICGIIWPWLNIEVLHFDHRFGGAGKQQKRHTIRKMEIIWANMWFDWHQNAWEDLLLHPVRHLKYFGTAPKGTEGHRHRLAFGMWCWARNGSRFCIADCNSTIADGATPPVIQAGNGQNVYVFDCMSYVQKNIGGQIAV